MKETLGNLLIVAAFAYANFLSFNYIFTQPSIDASEAVIVLCTMVLWGLMLRAPNGKNSKKESALPGPD